jgi:hypothetical protein
LTLQEEILKELEQFLGHQRTLFSRLYFLSDGEVVSMVGISRNPQALVPFARKCFPGVASMTFLLPPGTGSLNSALDFALNSKVKTLDFAVNSKVKTLDFALNSKVKTLDFALNSKVKTLDLAVNSKVKTLDFAVNSKVKTAARSALMVVWVGLASCVYVERESFNSRHI